MRKMNTVIMSLVMCTAILLSACERTVISASTPVAIQVAQTEKATEEIKESAQETPAPTGDVVTIQIGFGNVTEGPIGKVVEKWAELLAVENSGAMKLELFPNGSPGSKNELINQMIMGESTVTTVDGAFYAGYGVPDLGILYGSFFFDNWDEVWKLTDGDWCQIECGKLADKGLTMLANSWVYGERELMIKAKVVAPTDIKGKRIRLMNSQICAGGFNALGATAALAALDDVYTPLQNDTLDGVENPLSILYGQSFQEVSRNVLMAGHILNFTTWCIGTDHLSTLTPEQRELLYKTSGEAGLYNNEQQVAVNDDYRKKLEEAGVTSTKLTDEEWALWREASLSFYRRDSQFGWSDGLYDTVKVAMQ